MVSFLDFRLFIYFYLFLISGCSVFVVHVVQENMGSVSGNGIQDVERRNGSTV